MQQSLEQHTRQLPIVRFGGRDYYVNTELGQFQRVNKPWVAVSFDTMEGEAMMEATGVAVCPHCQHAVKIYGGRNNRHAQCPNCRGGLFE